MATTLRCTTCRGNYAEKLPIIGCVDTTKSFAFPLFPRLPQTPTARAARPELAPFPHSCSESHKIPRSSPIFPFPYAYHGIYPISTLFLPLCRKSPNRRLTEKIREIRTFLAKIPCIGGILYRPMKFGPVSKPQRTKGHVMTDRVKHVARHAIRNFGCAAEIRGASVRDILVALEKSGSTVYWGLFSENELAYVFPEK